MDKKKPRAKGLDGFVRPSEVRKPPKPKPAAPIKASSQSAPQESVDRTGQLHEIDFGEVDSSVKVPAWDSRPHPKPSRFKPTRKRVVLIVCLIAVIAVAFFGIKAVMASQKIITKNSDEGAPSLKGEVDPTKLKGEGDGRINILMLGIGGSNHDGGTLSDTMMVASIDPTNKTIAMLSIPRDLYVKIPKHGNTKINAANSYGGPELAKDVVGEVLDLPIHYYIQVDFSGFKQAVDAVGGVDIHNKTALSDPSYPCDNNRGYCPFSLAAGDFHLDGKTALKFARCRHGSCGNDFGRAERQQVLMVALRQKALEASTLTNPVKLSNLIDSIGNHVRTDLQINETKKLAKLIKDIDMSKATHKVLDNSADGLLVDGSGQFPGAGSILIPRAGAFEFSEIQELAHSIFVDAYLKQENAAVEIQNGTLKDGLGAALSRQLKAYNYNIVNVRTATIQNHTQSTIIDYTGGKKPYTIKYLQSRFKAKVQVAQPPETSDSSKSKPDIAIIVGSDYKITTR